MPLWLCPLLPEECLAPRWHVISVVELLIGVTVAAFLCDEHRRLSDLFWKLAAVVFLRGGAHSHSLFPSATVGLQVLVLWAPWSSYSVENSSPSGTLLVLF